MDFVKAGVRPSEEKILSYAEEKAAELKIKDLEDRLMGKELDQGLKMEAKDIQGIEKWLAHYKKMKSQMGASRFEGKERASAEMELRRVYQALVKKWDGYIPSYEEYWVTPKAGIRYLMLRDKLVKLNADKEYAELIRRWKYLRRRMEPDDPSADSVLHLFDKSGR